MFNKNFLNRRGKREGIPQRSDALPVKKISREKLNKAMDEYFKKGGKITKITEKDVMARRLDQINLLGFDESFNFLNGD